MRQIPLYLTALAILTLLSPASSEACLPNGAMDNLGVYLVDEKPRMKTLCNYCLGSALLPPSAIQSYNPKTGVFTLTNTGKSQLKKAMTNLGGKDKLLGRRFALVAQGRIAFTGTLVSSIMSRSLSSPVINLDNKSLRIAPSYPQGLANNKALPVPVNLQRAVLFQKMTQQLKATLEHVSKSSKFPESDLKKIEKLAQNSADPGIYQFAPFAILSHKRRHEAFRTLIALTKNGHDSQQKINAALAMASMRNGLYKAQKQVLRDCLTNALNSSGNQRFLEDAALALALGHDVKSIELLTKVSAQFKDSKKIGMALRYLKTDSSMSSPYGFGGK
ncbi:MAG: hypothetical protein P1V97_31935 [Planctomycetota bacterium]|nr:hypothetical protein [Planctomycetota bacterium]